MTPDPRIAGYLAELSQPGVPVVSTSHLTLRRLYREHGQEVIDALLAEHWDAENTAREITCILAGSCTPAIDLVRMVDDGRITAREATEVLQRSGRKIADVHSAAAAERDYMIRHDI